MATMKTNIRTVEEYLNALPEAPRRALEKIRVIIKSTAPKAEELISYGMPGYKYHGPLVYMAAFKDHLSFFPGSSQIIKLYDELKNFKTSKGTIQFTVEKPLPAGIVKKIVKARMAENKARLAAKQIKKPVKKSGKISPVATENQQVIAYMNQLEGIHKEDVNVLRNLIKKSSAKLNERIKWNAPSYYYKKDIVTIGPYKPGRLLLVFHHPAVVKVKSDLLQGDYKDRRLVYFKEAKEAMKKQKELARIIREIIKQIK
jgi:uncharacterized protein YdhG (YjbR/CyaY superfamily)